MLPKQCAAKLYRYDIQAYFCRDFHKTPIQNSHLNKNFFENLFFFLTFRKETRLQKTPNTTFLMLQQQ